MSTQAAATGSGTLAETRAPVDVHVHFEWHDGALIIEINPFQCNVPLHGSVKWHLSGAGRLEITHGARWPFGNPGPNGTATEPAWSGEMTSDAKMGDTITYEVVASGENLRGSRITIDPELIITPPAKANTAGDGGAVA